MSELHKVPKGRNELRICVSWLLDQQTLCVGFLTYYLLLYPQIIKCNLLPSVIEKYLCVIL